MSRLVTIFATSCRRLSRHRVAGTALCLLAMVPSLRWQAQRARVAPSQLLRDVSVIDGTGRAPMPHQDILITGDRIAALGPTGSLRIPAGTVVIETRGRHVIPGLIDAHVHLATFPREPDIQDALLRYALLGGVTSVRDMGGAIGELRAIAGRTRADGAPLPRFFYSAVMSGPQSMWFGGERAAYFASGGTVGQSAGVRQVDTTSDIRRVVTEARATGATGLKLYANLPPSVISALAQEGHRQGLRVWAHLAMWPGRPSDVVRGGADVVSHAPMFMRELVPEVAPGAPADVVAADRRASDSVYRAPSATTPAIAALLHDMRRRGTMLDPTLWVVLNASTSAGDSLTRARYRDVFRYTAAMTRAAHRAGIPIVAGTDGIGRRSPNIHAELQLLVDSAGLSPLEALRAATQHAAAAIGIADSVGTIQRGRLADLVLLEADPSADIANTQSVDMVIKGGVVHRRTGAMPLPDLARAARP